jgi:oxygen-independent coproporphyrinogen-3 oxidase
MTFRHVYVHVPFCRRRCVYCDFAIAVRRPVPHERFVSAIRAELETRRAAIAPATGGPETIYLGGGTPSLLEPEAIDRLLLMLRTRGDDRGRPDEITLEANPEDVTPDAASTWALAGVDRVSLGVQSFQPTVLAWMHRSHDPDAADRAVQALREAGVTTVSVDLIIGLPEAAGPDLANDFERVLALDPDHVSVYTLTVEPRTPLGKWDARGLIEPAPDERHATEFLRTHEVLTAAGFEHYEVSNYARPGLRARHNSAYWTGRPYLGLGPSAHSFDGVVRSWNVAHWAAYEEHVVAGREAIEASEILSGEQLLLERAYLGLRTVEGVPLNGLRWPSAAGDRAISEGWAEVAGDRLRLTPVGWLRLDAIVGALTTPPGGG